MVMMFVNFCFGHSIYYRALVTSKQVTGVDDVGEVAEFVFEAVSENDVATLGELIEIVFDLKAVEFGVFESWFIDDNFGAFAAEELDDVLNSGRAEVVRARFHS